MTSCPTDTGEREVHETRIDGWMGPGVQTGYRGACTCGWSSPVRRSSSRVLLDNDTHLAANWTAK